MFNKYIKTNFLISYSILVLMGLFISPVKLNAEKENLLRDSNNQIIRESNSFSDEDSLSQDSYILGPGDKLKLYLFDAPEFSGELMILNDGTVPFPLIGNQNLSNLTVNQAINLIQEK